MCETIEGKNFDLSTFFSNRQLWSCVRTGHVETALRLLALGASPNFMDQGDTPLVKKDFKPN
jgi:hypothetical protein